jgi:2'-5' RNA ligase
MTALRRGFLAVVPPPAVLRWTDSVIDAATSAARPIDGLRWTRIEQRHLTLQFLGPVHDAQALAAAVAESVRGFAPFTLRLGGAGAFPNARRASVLWIGVHEGAEPLAAIAEQVTRTTAASGYEPENRPFRAHVTVARAGRARDLREIVAALGATATSPSWSVDRVVLFDSDTRADGAVHTERATFSLLGSTAQPAPSSGDAGNGQTPPPKSEVVAPEEIGGDQ